MYEVCLVRIKEQVVLFLERLMYEVCLVRIKEQVGVMRNTVGTNKQGLQEKLCKAEQDCFGAPGTG
jgi:hypothetical protein